MFQSNLIGTFYRSLTIEEDHSSLTIFACPAYSIMHTVLRHLMTRRQIITIAPVRNGQLLDQSEGNNRIGCLVEWWALSAAGNESGFHAKTYDSDLINLHTGISY